MRAANHCGHCAVNGVASRAHPRGAASPSAALEVPRNVERKASIRGSVLGPVLGATNGIPSGAAPPTTPGNDAGPQALEPGRGQGALELDLSRPVVLLQGLGALEVEVQVQLPSETDAAVHLD